MIDEHRMNKAVSFSVTQSWPWSYQVADNEIENMQDSDTVEKDWPASDFEIMQKHWQCFVLNLAVEKRRVSPELQIR